MTSSLNSNPPDCRSARFPRSRSVRPVPPGFDARWIAAAQHERDRRAEKYPEMIASGELDEEWANRNYQAWCATAEWLEQGRSGWTSTPLVQLIGWAAMEVAAESQLASFERSLADGSADPARAATLRDRRDAIWCIHNLMVKQRELVEPTMREETAWARPDRSHDIALAEGAPPPEPVPA